MYTVIYLYRVDKDNKQDFVDHTDKLKEIFLDNGTLEYEVYQAEDLTGRNGYKGILDLLVLKPDEQVFLGQAIYRNQSHYEEVFDRVGENEDAKQLMVLLSDAVNDSKTFTGSFITPD